MANILGVESRKDGGGLLAALIITFSLQPFTATAAGPAASVHRLAVLPFESAHIGASGRAAGDLFNAMLVRDEPRLSVVERTSLEKVLGEQQLQHLSGLVDQETAARLKSVLGVDSLILGSIIALDHDGRGGGSVMVTARLVDTASGRVLWAESRTATLRESVGRRILRIFVDPPIVSDQLVAHKLLELAARGLVDDLLERVRPAAGAAAPVGAAARGDEGCAAVESHVNRLAESILVDEAMFWAGRLRAGDAPEAAPGSGYTDAALRERLTLKILFWLGEKDVPALEPVQVARLAEAKTMMKQLRSRCPAIASAERGEGLLASAAEGWGLR